MKYIIISIIVLFVSLSCAQQKEPLLGETDYQKEQNAKFKDASESPLTTKDLKSFKQLDFYKFNADYNVEAKITLQPNSEYFEMPTSTDRKPLYRVYAILSFELFGKPYELNVYQNEDLLNEKGFEDYLFLPFIDNTNGETTYGGGRYIELSVPKGNTLSIDFNKAFNPYCAYNYKYSCPVVPIENTLDLKVEAGVKMFKKK
ncbi:DUF1684 domain-containing protein [Aurantibacter sp.]|uniref:DUF1684 domain-containing protein n=1 Tax=Aurantibacter sp. TaxID=2807103 RepID=UPI0035C87515